MGDTRIHTQCMVLVPAGPDTVTNYLDDTIESINYHIGESNCIIALIDDSRQNRFAYTSNLFSNVLVFEAVNYGEGNRSVSENGSIFGKEIRALKQVVERYRFDVLLKMDTDALVIGDRPHLDILAFLEQNPDIGMVGAFTRRGDGSGKAEAMAYKGRQLTKEMSLLPGCKNLRLMKTLRHLCKIAERYNYRRGDTCTGGAYFLSSRVVQAMLEKGFLDLEVLRYSVLGEDSLMGLLCYACGYRLSDMPDDNDVLAINWRGLPMPLEELVARSKKIVHPIKDDNPAVEANVRAFFRKKRMESSANRIERY